MMTDNNNITHITMNNINNSEGTLQPRKFTLQAGERRKPNRQRRRNSHQPSDILSQFQHPQIEKDVEFVDISGYQLTDLGVANIPIKE